MTHSGGLPHTNIGDRGQRYEILCNGYPKEGEEKTVGWAATIEGAYEMIEAFCQAPGTVSVTIIDRADGARVPVITRYAGVLR